MAISLRIEGRAHGVIRDTSGLSLEALDALAIMVSQADQASLLHGIDPYSDTMFNMVQLKRLLRETAAVDGRNDAEWEAIEGIREAAEEAIRARGYLWFIGDLAILSLRAAQPGGGDESNRMIAERLQRQHVLYQPGKHVRVIMLEAVLRSGAAGGVLVSCERGFLPVPSFPRGRRMITERH